jgi:uncharacterized protein YndB with AHSA1/START domain
VAGVVERRGIRQLVRRQLQGKTFTPGQRTHGQITYPGYEHIVFEVWIERMEPEKLLSWRWHPAAVERERRLLGEPTTLVVFELEDAEGGTAVRRRIRLSTTFRRTGASTRSA